MTTMEFNGTSNIGAKTFGLIGIHVQCNSCKMGLNAAFGIQSYALVRKE